MKKGLRLVADFFKHADQNDVFGIAAKTAFFFLLSLFPLTMVAGWALAYTDLSLSVLEDFLPGDLLVLFETTNSPAPLSNPVLIVGALWSASSGVWALMRGVNQSYGGARLPFFKARALSIVFTLGFLCVLTLTLTFLAIDRRMMMLSVGAAIFLLLFALYTLTPGTSARPARAAWTAALAAGAWLFVSWGFEIYMRYFSRFDALYGSVGVFMGLAIWVFVICIVIIFGAEMGGYKPEENRQT